MFLVLKTLLQTIYTFLGISQIQLNGFWKKKFLIEFVQTFFETDIDLFASRLNAQLDCFVSWFAEPGATHVNAFGLTWSDFAPYTCMFPPFSLIGQVLNKLKRDKVEKAILVFRLWRSQVCFLVLKEMLCTFPVRLPRHRDLMVLLHNGQSHPLSKRITWLLLVYQGIPSRSRAFKQTADIILNSWRPGTQKQYEFAWRKWYLWCLCRKSDPFITNEMTVLKYLDKLHRQKRSYTVLNTRESMLLQTLPPFGNSWCDNTSLIKCCMKGISQLKPPMPC